MKKILMLITCLFLCSCSNLPSMITTKQKSNDDMSFNISKLKYTYFTYLNLPKLISVQNLNNEAISYLLDQLSGKETEFRLLVEQKEILNDDIKYSICNNLDDVLCDLNYHIYAGTKFGFNLYQESSKNKDNKNEILLAPLTFWSVKWISDSKDEALIAVNTCKNNKECIYNNISNPISNIYSACYLQYGENKDNNIDFKHCMENYLDTNIAKDYFFIIGYLVGYNISYGLNNNG